MGSAERVLSAEARARLDEHLGSVDRVLAEAGVPASDRRSICDEVEAQACEMAWARAEGEPTEQHMRAVLAELDDPEAYRDAAEPGGQACAARPVAAGPSIHPYALCALVVPIAEVFLAYCYAHFARRGAGRAILATAAFHGGINIVGWLTVVLSGSA